MSTLCRLIKTKLGKQKAAFAIYSTSRAKVSLIHILKAVILADNYDMRKPKGMFSSMYHVDFSHNFIDSTAIDRI